MTDEPTDRSYRALLAVWMYLSFAGYPVGAALAGALADRSLDLAIIAAVVACALAALFAALMVPRRDPDEAALAATRGSAFRAP